MGYLYVLMGKSATGKDSVYKNLIRNQELNLKQATTYTTRPIRDGEQDGVEYNFVGLEELKKFRQEGKIIEERYFDIVSDRWYYFTVDNGDIDLDSGNYLMINTIPAFTRLREYFGKNRVVPIYLYVRDILRLSRAVNRELNLENANPDEICRRYLADKEDFKEERLSLAGIDIEYRFENENFEVCVSKIIKSIKERL